MGIMITAEQLNDYVGKEVGISDWLIVSQNLIDAFADNTFDHQYIHTDPARAAKTPFGGTIAHGMLVLSLLPRFNQQSGIELQDAAMGLNYGFDKVRFIQPVAVNSQVRGRLQLDSADERRPGQVQLKYNVTVDIKDQQKPALIAEWLVLYLLNPQ